MRTANLCPTCATYENAVCVIYNGALLTNTGIAPLDNMQVALGKIDTSIGTLTNLINNLPASGVQGVVAGTNVSVDNTNPAFPIVSATGATGPQGLTGPAGAQGVAGPQGVPGPVGPTGLNWQGAWSASGTYVVDDAVGYNGASWFCIANVGPTATTPNADPTKWALLAAQGATGPAGPQGPTGATGPAGASNGWVLTGNAGTNPATNFMGTTDAQDVIFKCNNTEYLKFKSVTGGNDEVTFSRNIKLNNGSLAQIWVSGPSSYITLSSGTGNNPQISLSKSSSTVNVGSTNITGTKTLQLPNANGTLVTSVNSVVPDAAGNVNLSSATPSLSAVTSVGNQTSSDILINPSTPTGIFEINASTNGGGFARLGTSSSFEGYLRLGQSGGISGTLKADNLNTSRVIDLPDAAGTLAVSVNGIAANSAGNIVLPSSGWGLLGNSGTVDSVNFIGTTDGQSLVMKANNVEYLRLNPNSGIIEAAKEISLYAGGAPYIEVLSASGFGNAAIGTDSVNKGILRLSSGPADAFVASANISSNRLVQLPDNNGTLAVSVNGISADTAGNVTVPRPYLVYTARFDNSSLTPVILENTLGVALSVTNPSGQIYEFTAPSAIFLANKTWVMPSNYIAGGESYNFFGVRWTDTKVRYTAINNPASGNTGFNGQIFIEIRVYP